MTIRQATFLRCGVRVLLFFVLCARAVAELPGEELTPQRFEAVVRRGGAAVSPANAAATTDNATPQSTSTSWLQSAMSTWNAPALGVQMSTDETIIPFGKGGIFVPRYTEINNEPDVEIFDMSGKTAGLARTGSTVSVVPGEYTVMLGSGTKQQRISKRVTVHEGRVTPVIPDWSGLIIDVVDEQGVALRGEYELVRIDEFDPYGRGYGASIELGETVKAWILKPGLYKILGAGAGYNTMTNFVTVRLMPGELTSFMLIQDPDNFRILGGGTLHMTPTTKITSNWRIGANVGANLQFIAEFDHENDLDMNSLTIGLLLDTWLLYRKKPMDWSTRLRLEESINIVDNDPGQMVNSPDRLLMSSIFIWRVLNWFGPYARAEFNTKFFDTKIRRGKENYFCFVDTGYVFDASRAPDTSLTFVIEPSFSPTIFEIGAGVNIDFTSQRYLEAGARLGFGSSFSRYGDRYRVIEANKVKYDATDSLRQKSIVSGGVILYPEEKINISEAGPQIAVSTMVRLGIVATAEAEIKFFAPIIPEPRLSRPDLDFNGTLSWRLSSIINLDYTYRQSLRQPTELTVPVHTSSHGIWLRLHFASR